MKWRTEISDRNMQTIWREREARKHQMVINSKMALGDNHIPVLPFFIEKSRMLENS